MSSMNSGIEKSTGRDYWRSLEEYARTPEFQAMIEREFPSTSPDVVSEATRRDFLKVMGASLAMAGLTGCRWPEEKILPFTTRPEGRMPGVPVYYATAMELSGVARGLLVKSFDGRPVKVEGNPVHPESQGASDILSQSVILEMYDPDRMQELREVDRSGGFARTWSEFASAMESRMATHQARNGAGLVVLAEASASPTLLRLREELRASMPASRWYEWEAVSRENERAGTRAAFGRDLRPHYRFQTARVIASFDDDFFLGHPASVQYAFDFAEGRRMSPAGVGHGDHGADGHGAVTSGAAGHGAAGHAGHAAGGEARFNRLYVVESSFSAAGGMADHRLPVLPSEIETVLGELAAELFLERGLTHPAGDALRARLGAFRQGQKHGAFVKQMAADLLAERGASLVVVGVRQSAVAHALGHAINAALGNVGHTVEFTEEPGVGPSVAGIREAVEAMRAGGAETLLILGGNPVFDAPADLDFAAALEKVDTAIHLTLHANETTEACRWRLPRAHFLESWGDARAWNGTVSVVQPLIRPLYEGRSTIEVLATLVRGGLPKGYDLVRETHQASLGGVTGLDFEANWRAALHDGIVPGTAWVAIAVEIDPAALAAATTALAPREGGRASGEIELVLAPDAHVYDGRFANNGWLQELPHTVTKVAWDNALLLGPRTIQDLGLADGDMVRLEKDGRSIEVPVWTTPGQASHSGTLHFGYGRRTSGKVGTGVGFDAYPLRTTAAMHQVSNVRITKTGAVHAFSSTQDHFAIDEAGIKATQGRLSTLIQEATVADYLSGHGHDDHGHHPPALPLWDPHQYDGHKWGLSVDLNACTGCNACVVACQAENNIPVVGKKEVGRGREMHWIRIDRYFRGSPEDPQIALQPVTCQQCENAPCEQVCPVAATVHTHEGLNDMVYNRCIGTRYCANNCPYKVRRFNYFNFNGGMSSLEKMRANPDVTMRARGVMEKCTFCVQRIQAVKIEAKNEKRPIADGEIRTACEQACPTHAIVFGDLNDPKSRVRALQESDRAYALLDEYLHTKPRLKYLKRLRNPAPGLTAASGDHGSGGGAHHG